MNRRLIIGASLFVIIIMTIVYFLVYSDVISLRKQGVWLNFSDFKEHRELYDGTSHGVNGIKEPLQTKILQYENTANLPYWNRMKSGKPTGSEYGERFGGASFMPNKEINSYADLDGCYKECMNTTDCAGFTHDYDKCYFFTGEGSREDIIKNFTGTDAVFIERKYAKNAFVDDEPRID